MLGHKNIGGFNIAMNNAFFMGGFQRIGYLNAEFRQPFGWNRSLFRNVLESAPLQKLHSDEGMALILIDSIDGADMRVIKCRSSLRLALEARERAGITCHVIGEKLQGGTATKTNIL